MIDIRRAGPEDIGAIKTLLAVCLLPAHDVSDSRIRFLVAESDRGIIGVSGFEVLANGVALLRSLAVMPGYRKQQIGRRLVNRTIAAADDDGIGRIFLLTESATDYFSNVGFVAVPRDQAPPELGAATLDTRPCSRGATLMRRDAKAAGQGDATRAVADIALAAQAHFDSGYYCAESVLLAVAARAGIHSPLLPAIATGFCNGIAGNRGTCGALSGAVMAVNLVYGRNSPEEPVAQNYVAVRKLIDEFGKTCGATSCSELLACDLDSKDGRKTYEDDHLRDQCREYIATAARIAGSLVQQRIDLKADSQACAKAA
jgi:C_GCAxxG_C_C family probable redox protein